MHALVLVYILVCARKSLLHCTISYEFLLSFPFRELTFFLYFILFRGRWNKFFCNIFSPRFFLLPFALSLYRTVYSFVENCGMLFKITFRFNGNGTNFIGALVGGFSTMHQTVFEKAHVREARRQPELTG